MKSRYIISLIGFLFSHGLVAQEKYGELRIGELEEWQEGVVTKPEISVVRIVSEIPNLRFESTLTILDTISYLDNEWELYIEARTQTLTIRASGYLPKEKLIFPKSKRAYKLQVFQVKPVPGTLFIETRPEGAKLRINGSPIDALTPFRNDEAPPGRYFVQILKDGYPPVDTAMTVKAKEVTECKVELIPLEPIKTPLLKKWWFLSGSAATLVGGIVYFTRGEKQTIKPPESLASHPEFP